MTHEELITRLSIEVISEMPYDDFAHLTNDFDEKDVRTILVKSDDIEIQRRVFASIKEKYIQWDEARDPLNFNLRSANKSMFGRAATPDYPKYFDDIALSLKYNFLIETKEKFSMPYVSPVRLRQRIAETKPTETPDISKYKAQIKELEAENAALRKQLEESQSQPQAGNIPEVRNDEWIVELLSHLMYENEQNAKVFLEKIQGMTDAEITDVVAEWVKDKKISSKSCRRDMWRILHAAKLYNATESNYNAAMNHKQ